MARYEVTDAEPLQGAMQGGLKKRVIEIPDGAPAPARSVRVADDAPLTDWESVSASPDGAMHTMEAPAEAPKLQQKPQVGSSSASTVQGKDKS